MHIATTSIDDLLLSPEYVESPYATYDLLRSKHPVYWCAKWNGWIITRFDDVLALLQDFKRFSNCGRYTEYLSPLSAEQRSRLKYLQNHYEHGGLVQSDPPKHNRLRKLINSAFTPRIVAQMEGLVRDIVSSLIDEFAGNEEVELIYEFAFPLPAKVIAGMLGVPEDKRDQFKHWSSTIQRFLGSGVVDFEYALAAQDAWRRMNDYFESLLARRRKEPRDDLVSELVHAREDGERLTEEEVVRTCGAILIAGHETTTNLISNGIWRLLERPELLAMLKSDPSLYPSAVEEFLRCESPFQSAPRTATEDVELRGQVLKRGELVYAMLGAANRDPKQFENPNRLDICRQNNKHLAFGYGIHFCLGAALARLEAPIAIQTLLDRFPNLRLDPNRPPVWKPSMVQRGMELCWLQLE